MKVVVFNMRNEEEGSIYIGVLGNWEDNIGGNEYRGLCVVCVFIYIV